MRECFRCALEDPPRARFHANAKNSNSPFHSTIFTAQNVGDIVEYRDASSSKTSSIKSALSHHHGDGKRHERQFPEVRGFYTAVAWSRMLDKGTCKRRFFSTEIFFSSSFFLLKKECSFGSPFKESPFFCFFAQEDTLGKVTLELCVSIILRGGRSMRLRRRKQHALTPPPPPSLFFFFCR